MLLTSTMETKDFCFSTCPVVSVQDNKFYLLKFIHFICIIIITDHNHDHCYYYYDVHGNASKSLDAQSNFPLCKLVNDSNALLFSGRSHQALQQ